MEKKSRRGGRDATQRSGPLSFSRTPVGLRALGKKKRGKEGDRRQGISLDVQFEEKKKERGGRHCYRDFILPHYLSRAAEIRRGKKKERRKGDSGRSNKRKKKKEERRHDRGLVFNGRASGPQKEKKKKRGKREHLGVSSVGRGEREGAYPHARPHFSYLKSAQYHTGARKKEREKRRGSRKNEEGKKKESGIAVMSGFLSLYLRRNWKTAKREGGKENGLQNSQEKKSGLASSLRSCVRERGEKKGKKEKNRRLEVLTRKEKTRRKNDHDDFLLFILLVLGESKRKGKRETRPKGRGERYADGCSISPFCTSFRRNRGKKKKKEEGGTSQV